MDSLLIVEDEKNLAYTLKEFLEAQGHKCYLAMNCATAKEYARKLAPEHFLVGLLDITLPDGNGLELAKELKKEHPNWSFLFLSALNDPEMRLAGLEAGAEDYITKPFALKELLLRLQKMLSLPRQVQKINKSLEKKNIIHGKLHIHFPSFEVIDAYGNHLTLSHKEWAILKLLYQKAGEVVDRNSILDEVWGEDANPGQRTIDNYIVRLRRWCETDKEAPIGIHNVRGVGYKMIIKDLIK